jgi:hypothetical protein
MVVRVGQIYSPAPGAKETGDQLPQFGLHLFAEMKVRFRMSSPSPDRDVNNFVVGAEVFADFHNQAATKKDGGIDAKVGIPFNHVMPYARLGITTFWPNTRLHYGLGVEYKFAKNLSVAGEWTADTANTDGTKRSNNSLTMGLHYYFF